VGIRGRRKSEESERGIYARLRRFGEKVFDFTILPFTSPTTYVP